MLPEQTQMTSAIELAKYIQHQKEREQTLLETHSIKRLLEGKTITIKFTRQCYQNKYKSR